MQTLTAFEIRPLQLLPASLLPIASLKKRQTRICYPQNRHRNSATTSGLQTHEAVVPPRIGNSNTLGAAAAWLATFSLLGVVGVAAYRYVAYRRQVAERADEPEAQAELLHEDHSETEEFKIVLTSVRQAVTFQRAVQSMRTGDTARAMVELYRVLEENAICRTPLETASFSNEELEKVYRFHLQNTELPSQYSTLLHLRQLLGIGSQRAEELEKELKGSASQFSI